MVRNCLAFYLVAIGSIYVYCGVSFNYIIFFGIVNAPLYVVATGYDIDNAPSQWCHFQCFLDVVQLLSMLYKQKCTEKFGIVLYSIIWHCIASYCIVLYCIL